MHGVAWRSWMFSWRVEARSIVRLTGLEPALRSDSCYTAKRVRRGRGIRVVADFSECSLNFGCELGAGLEAQTPCTYNARDAWSAA